MRSSFCSPLWKLDFNLYVYKVFQCLSQYLLCNHTVFQFPWQYTCSVTLYSSWWLRTYILAVRFAITPPFAWSNMTWLYQFLHFIVPDDNISLQIVCLDCASLCFVCICAYYSPSTSPRRVSRSFARFGLSVCSECSSWQSTCCYTTASLCVKFSCLYQENGSISVSFRGTGILVSRVKPLMLTMDATLFITPSVHLVKLSKLQVCWTLNLRVNSYFSGLFETPSPSHKPPTNTISLHPWTSQTSSILN